MPLPPQRAVYRHLVIRLLLASLAVGFVTALYLAMPGPITGGLGAAVGILAAGLFAVELERHAL